jgi:hypothetical protein
MAQNLLCYQRLLIALGLICLLIHVWWSDTPRVTLHRPLKHAKLQRKRSKEPKPFPGLLHKPLCEACEHRLDARPTAPGAPPPVMIFTRGRRRTVDTQQQFCPAPDCSYYGWLARGNIRAKDILVASPGASCSVSRATAISLRRTARSFMASAPRWSSSCASSHVSPKAWASGAPRGSSRSTPIPCWAG